MGLVLCATWEGTISGCPCGISDFGTLELDYSFLRKTSWQHFSDNHRDSKFLSSPAHRLSFQPFDLHQKMRCQPQHPVHSCHKPSSCPGTTGIPKLWKQDLMFTQKCTSHRATKQSNCSGFEVTKNHESVRHRYASLHTAERESVSRLWVTFPVTVVWFYGSANILLNDHHDWNGIA